MARSRSSSRQLIQRLDASSRPIYVLDDRRRFVFCNQACRQWLGVDESAVLGVRCDYYAGPLLDDDPSAEVTAGLCPPPEAFHADRTSGEVFCRRATGELSHRCAEFVPLGSHSVEELGVMVIVDGCEAGESSAQRATSDDSESTDLHRRLFVLRQEIGRRYRASRLVGQGDVMTRVRSQVELAIAGDASVLIVGLPGSGRQHISRAIHFGDDPKSAGPLVPLSCPICDAEMIQEAIRDLKQQPVDLATQSVGTLLLLEVDCLPEGAQHELAGFLRLPGFRLTTIATAQNPLLPAAEAGRFLDELALALCALVIEIPPLAERRDDVPLLAQCFLEEMNTRSARQFSGFSPDALDLLAAYPWPGNVDELYELVEETCGRAAGPLITPADLPPQIRQAAHAAIYAKRDEETIVLEEFLGEIERELIIRALRRAKGNKTKAAQRLGITRAKLLRRLGQLGVESNT